MSQKNTALGRWQQLDAKRTGLITRCERFAALTLPSVFPEDSYDEGQDQLSQSLNSIGAQAVNNLVNKMVLAMFAPSRPFMRLDLPADQKEKILKALGMTEQQFKEELSVAEKEMVRFLDGTGSRPKLFDLFAHLIVTGNALRLTEGNSMRVISLRDYVVRRNIRGEVIEIILREEVCKDELPEALQPFLNSKDSDENVSYFRW